MIVRTLTENYIGRVEFERHQPRGLTVRIILPAGPVEQSQAASPQPERTTNSSQSNQAQRSILDDKQHCRS